VPFLLRLVRPALRTPFPHESAQTQREVYATPPSASTTLLFQRAVVAQLALGVAFCEPLLVLRLYTLRGS